MLTVTLMKKCTLESPGELLKMTDDWASLICRE